MIWYSDFETGRDDKGTYVWSAATITDNTKKLWYSSIKQYVDALLYYKPEEVYFHNLKFDGSFILYELLNRGWNQSYENGVFYKDYKMPNKTFKYMISAMGVWYSITIKTKNKIIRVYDSMKLAPMSLKNAGIAYHTKHQKLEMDFNHEFKRGYRPSKKEMDYIWNDVYVLKEFMEAIRSQGLDKMTIGSCCLSKFKEMFTHTTAYDWDIMFPNLYQKELPNGLQSYGDFVQNSYHGAFVYCNKYKKGVKVKNGKTLDVNSLYPTVMHSSSGNRFPVGFPKYWVKEEDKLKGENKIHFYHFKTRFYLRNGMLPFVHIRKNPLYKATKTLESSDVEMDGKFYRYVNKRGELYPTVVEMYMNSVEFDTFKKHYRLEDFEMIDGLSFHTEIGIFDNYINFWMDKKAKSKGAERTIAKAYLVNLYGKFAMSTDSSFKILREESLEKGLRFETVYENDKKPGYIPIGACVTSFAMLFTLEHAQKCYHGREPGFCYSDTDSIHLDGDVPDYFKIHDSDLGAWKVETEWDTGLFQGPKCYIEHENDDLNITCAGLPDRGKRLFAFCCGYKTNLKTLSEEEAEFLKNRFSIEDFKPGLRIPGKLMPKQIPGGMVLEESEFTMKRRL